MLTYKKVEDAYLDYKLGKPQPLVDTLTEVEAVIDELNMLLQADGVLGMVGVQTSVVAYNLNKLINAIGGKK
jgi:hypothetical protein